MLPIPRSIFLCLTCSRMIQNLADEKQEIDEETITDLEARYKDAERIISQELAERAGRLKGPSRASDA